TVIADPPFDDPDADIILRSSDDIEFRASKLYLSKASQFFSGMFELPQGPASNDQEMCDGVPVVPMPEPASVVKHFLQCCYPHASTGNITFDDVLSVSGLLEAARKYGVDGVEAIVRLAVGGNTALLQNQPFEVYALAVHNKWEAEAKAAARRLL
ncbi:hypothetical protein FIBSPDRAFT_678182, partial [Athelia psychrophila]